MLCSNALSNLKKPCDSYSLNSVVDPFDLAREKKKERERMENEKEGRKEGGREGEILILMCRVCKLTLLWAM